MKKWIIGLVVLGLMVGGSLMAVAEQTASPEETQKWIQKEAPSQWVPPVPSPTPVEPSTGTVTGSTTTVQGSTTTTTSPPAQPKKK